MEHKITQDPLYQALKEKSRELMRQIDDVLPVVMELFRTTAPTGETVEGWVVEELKKLTHDDLYDRLDVLMRIIRRNPYMTFDEKMAVMSEPPKQHIFDLYKELAFEWREAVHAEAEERRKKTDRIEKIKQYALEHAHAKKRVSGEMRQKRKSKEKTNRKAIADRLIERDRQKQEGVRQERDLARAAEMQSLEELLACNPEQMRERAEAQLRKQAEEREKYLALVKTVSADMRVNFSSYVDELAKKEGVSKEAFTGVGAYDVAIAISKRLAKSVANGDVSELDATPKELVFKQLSECLVE